MTKNQKAFRAMVTKAIEYNRPSAYHDDLLYHDRITLGLLWTGETTQDTFPSLQIKEGESFGWILREHGTEMLRLCNDEYKVRANARSTAYYYGTQGQHASNPHRWFYWDADTEKLIEFNDYASFRQHLTIDVKV